MRLQQALCLTAAFCLAPGAQARSTIVIAPSFEDLVAQAETIFLGEVVDRSSRFDQGRGGKSIVTQVTFNVIETWKGPAARQTRLEFLGGAVGDIGLVVEDRPEFQAGDRDVLFVITSERSANPIVGAVWGRFRVVRNPISGRYLIRQHDGSPLGSTTQIGDPRASGTVQAEMSLDAFKAEVMRALAGPK